MSDEQSRLSPQQILEKIIADKRISENEVRALRDHIRADWIVDHQEAELLFQVNQAIQDKDKTCPQWKDFFASTLLRLVVLDMESTGELDEREGDWMADMLDKYSVDNEAEKALLFEIRNTTNKISGRLGERIQPF